MVKKQYNRKTADERKEEIKAISETALSQIEKYSHSPEALLEYADFLSNFHSYSPNNTALIHEQFDGAEAVASFKDWKDKGYSVNKGEKGIKILSFTPITYFKDSKGGIKQVSKATKQEKELIKQGEMTTWKTKSFKIGHVFDVSQTNAPIEDLPKIFPDRQFNFELEDGNNAEYLKKGIQSVANELNIEIKDMKQSTFGLYELGSAKGAFVQGLNSNRKEIILNSRNTETLSIATSIHELAHAKLHDKTVKGSEFDQPTKEFQAELTSYIVCKHYGMDTSEKAIPYIANWTKNGQDIEEKQKAIEGVHNTSKEFIEVMDKVISEEKEKDMQMEQEYGTVLYPKNPNVVRYCDLTGKPFANSEPYYYVDGITLSEKAHKALYTEEEWTEIYNDNPDENNWVEEMYDLPETELTEVEPKTSGDNAIYYTYNPNDQSKPEKLGTISDIVTKAGNQSEIDRFVFTKEFIEELAISKNLDKESFNQAMGEKYAVLKNPKLEDFQQMNEKNGLDKNANLEDNNENDKKRSVDMKKVMAMQNRFER